MSENVKTQKELEALKIVKTEALVALGQLKHQEFREGKVTENLATQLSEKIMNIDVQLYTGSGNRIPLKEEGVCPGCGETLPSAVAAFCGKCGLNIQEFYDADMIYCNQCGQLINKDAKFCSICGISCSK